MRTIRIFFGIIATGLLLGGTLSSIAATSGRMDVNASYCTLDQSASANQNSAGGIDVIYLNGISNSAADAMTSMNALSTGVVANIRATYPQIHVSNIYNPAGGQINDANELGAQAALEAAARSMAEEYVARIKERHPNLPESTLEKIESSKYLHSLAELYTDYFLRSRAWDRPSLEDGFVPSLNGSVEDGDADGKGQFIGPVILKIVSAIEEKLFAGRRVVVVAHSQGNHFIVAAHALLKERWKTQNPRLLDGLQVVGVAAVSNTTPSDKWVTLRQDRAVNEFYNDGWHGWYGVGNLSRPLGYPDGNFDGVAPRDGFLGGTDGLSAENITAEWDSNGHNFVDIYLNDRIVRADDHSSTLRGEVESLVRAAIGDTQLATAQIELGPVTATLDWVSTGGADVDLHVREQFGDNSQKHVYFDVQEGRLGYLDRDDLNGPGPEHYYTKTACADLQGKTLVFGVRPFGDWLKNRENEPTVLSLRVGKDLYSRSFMLRYEDGKGEEGEVYGRTIFTLAFKEDGEYKLTDHLD
jgi:hypothetical protein